MKKTEIKTKGAIAITLIVSGTILLSGCGKTESKSKVGMESKENIKIEQSEEKVSKEDSEKILNDYYELLKKDTDPKELIKFVDENIVKLDKEDGDTVFFGLEEYLKATLPLLEEDYKKANESMDFQNAFDIDVEKENAKNIKDENLRKLVEDTFESGFLLYKDEGDIYPGLDYSFMKKYEDFVTEEMKNYIELKSIESAAPFSNGFAIDIKPEQILDRALNSEKHLVKYNEGRTTKKVYEMYASYIEAAIMGTGNPLVYAETEESSIRKEVLDVYKTFAENNKDSRTSKVISQYVETLNKNKNKLDAKEVKDFQEKIFELLRDNFKDISF
ncbi:hypothetical protein [Tissierella praeacuta]|uniref:hypothetical protein n=1 Tax=Tissierella praeacuta TaxID=43131 RepID=UPI002FDB24F6